jgi:hypothetical protein
MFPNKNHQFPHSCNASCLKMSFSAWFKCVMHGQIQQL